MSRRNGITAVALAALVAAGATSGAAGAGTAKKGGGKLHKATVGAGFYAPAKLTIKAGDRVRWTWKANGFDLHDITVDAGPERFESPMQASGTWTRTFRKPGTFRLVCTQHGDMGMTLVVKKAARGSRR